ncbi:hypothetical protein SPF06_19510 [Sinomonas sp. JGH33]|uniref:Uncharacterized protein n=1 Tax=Sinomonas terricola TaxID=3110330 RepID=A0ABU5TB49_9MICC|nr:hypothetical protein [Sinomonas sp. JGH33]MEA5456916.1 hypothetical protein [Sinomonas sp. JGH33]
MAGTRKSAAQLAARERARERAAEFTRRNEQLIGLAAEYFEAEQAADRILAEAREAAAAIIAKAEAEAEQAAGRSAGIVRAMLATGESRAGVAERLGVSAAEVKRAAEAPAAVPGAEAGSESAGAAEGREDGRAEDAA